MEVFTMAGLLDKIKSDAKKAGTNKKKIFYVRDGEKKRVRFLQDVDDGFEYTFHDSYEAGINVPCQEQFNKFCDFCDDESVRTRSLYVWSVWDYDAKEVKLFLYAVNNCSPIPALLALYDTYGTLTDRDYVISVSGKQQNKTFAVVPMDKAKFRNEKAKALSHSAVDKVLMKAFPYYDDEDDDDEEDDYEEKKSKGKGKGAGNKKKQKPEPDDDYDDDDDDYDDDEDDDDEADYSELSPKELYKLCKERSIDVQQKKSAKYYIKQLEEYDKAQDDWGDDGEEDDDEDW